MERKASENLVAAELLLTGEPSTNAATARAYYAAHHAAWSALVEAGNPVPDGPRGRYFSHQGLPAEVLRRGLLDEDAWDDLDWLQGRRVVADYYEDDIGLDEARQCLAIARTLVERLLEADEGGMPT